MKELAKKYELKMMYQMQENDWDFFMKNTVSCNAKNITYARIFDMTMHTIISGDTKN